MKALFTLAFFLTISAAFGQVYLRERGADLRDIGRRVLSYLQADAREKIIYPEFRINKGNPTQVFNYILAVNDIERIKSFSDIHLKHVITNDMFSL